MFHRFIRGYVEAFRGVPRPVWWISLILLVNRSGTMVLPFWALYCTQEREFAPSVAGQLIGIYGVGSVIGSYLGGVLTNRFGPMRVQATSLWLTAAGFLCLMNASTIPTMAIALLALSIVADAIRPACGSATAALCPEHLHSRAFALNRLAINLGMSIGATVGGLLAEKSFRLLFIVDASTCLVAAVLATYLAFRLRVESQEEDRRGSLTASGPWSDRPFLLTIGLFFLVALVFFQLMSTFPLHLRDHYGFQERQIGLAYAVNTLLIVATEMWLVKSVENFDKLKVIAWGSLFSCVGFGITGYGSTMQYAVFAVVIWTIGEMLQSPVSLAYVSGRATFANRGSYLAIYSMTFASASVIAPIVGTWVYERDPMLLWHGCLVIGICTFAGYLWLSHSERKQSCDPHSGNAHKLAESSLRAPD